MKREELQAMLEEAQAERAGLDAQWAEVGQQIEDLKARLRALEERRDSLSGIGWRATGQMQDAAGRVCDAQSALGALDEGHQVVRLRRVGSTKWELGNVRSNTPRKAAVWRHFSSLSLPDESMEVHPEDVCEIKALNTVKRKGKAKAATGEGE